MSDKTKKMVMVLVQMRAEDSCVHPHRSGNYYMGYVEPPEEDADVPDPQACLSEDVTWDPTDALYLRYPWIVTRSIESVRMQNPATGEVGTQVGVHTNVFPLLDFTTDPPEGIAVPYPERVPLVIPTMAMRAQIETTVEETREMMMREHAAQAGISLGVGNSLDPECINQLNRKYKGDA